MKEGEIYRQTYGTCKSIGRIYRMNKKDIRIAIAILIYIPIISLILALSEYVQVGRSVCSYHYEGKVCPHCGGCPR